MKCTWCNEVVFPDYDDVEQCPYCGVWFCKKHAGKKGNSGAMMTIADCYKLILYDEPEEKYVNYHRT